MIDRSNEIWWHELARFYKENGMNAQAAQAFSMAISLCEKGTLSFVNLVYLAEVCHDAGQFDKAVGAYKKAEAFGKMTHSQLYGAGNCYRDAGMLDDAMRSYLAATKAAQTDPGVKKSMALLGPGLRQWYSPGFSDLGRMYADRGQIEKAAEAIHNAIPTWKHSEVWLYVSTLVEQKHPELVQKCDETYRRLKAQGK
jgi:tetratricopeptide (TPR) repeat protein